MCRQHDLAVGVEAGVDGEAGADQRGVDGAGEGGRVDAARFNNERCRCGVGGGRHCDADMRIVVGGRVAVVEIGVKNGVERSDPEIVDLPGDEANVVLGHQIGIGHLESGNQRTRHQSDLAAGEVGCADQGGKPGSVQRRVNIIDEISERQIRIFPGQRFGNGHGLGNRGSVALGDLQREVGCRIGNFKFNVGFTLGGVGKR